MFTCVIWHTQAMGSGELSSSQSDASCSNVPSAPPSAQAVHQHADLSGVVPGPVVQGPLAEQALHEADSPVGPAAAASASETQGPISSSYASSSNDIDPGCTDEVSLLPGEIQLDGVNLQAEPLDNFGIVAIFMERFGLRNVLARRRCVLVLRHPHLQRGIALLSDTHEACRTVARSVTASLGSDGSQPLSLDVYTALAYDSAWRAEISSVPISGQQAGNSGNTSATSGDSQSTSSANHAHPTSSATQAQPTSSANQAQPTSSASSDQPEAESPGECPICFEAMEPMQAAMRCSGMGGQHHYFHRACMQQWIQQCRGGRTNACCPICRGRLEFNAQRLDDFLRDPSSANLHSDDRTFLESVADRIRNAGNSWQDACTTENALHVGGLVAVTGWGFMLGYMNPHPCLQHSLMIQEMSTQHRVAQGVGWVAGTIVRHVREERRRARERERQNRCN